MKRTALLGSACLTAFLLSEALAVGQSIETDTRKWLSYEIRYEDGTIRLRVPRNHRFKDDPLVTSAAFDEGRRVKQIFTAQYDYGWRRWSNISQFEVIYTLVRLIDPLPLTAAPMDIVPSLNAALKEDRGGRPSASEQMRKTVVELENGAWIHFTVDGKPLEESYARKCSSDFVLLVAPIYKDGALIKNPKWVSERRELFNKMLINIQC